MRALILRSKLSFITVANPAEISKTADAFLRAQLRQAARAWLRAVLVRVPQYTGTARGTFKPLGQFLHVTIPPGKIYAKDRRRLGQHLAKGSKSVQGSTYQIGPSSNDYAEFSFDYGPREYKFIFTQNLPWAIWNDIYPAPAWITLPSNPPWHAIQAGNAAFKNYLRVEMPKRVLYKQIKDMILRFKIVRV